MLLKMHSDASYISKLEACSCYSDFIYLGNEPTNKANVALLVTSTIMRNVISSVVRAECGLLFNNTKDSVPIWTTLLEEMGHPQPTIPKETGHPQPTIPNPPLQSKANL